MITEGYVRIDQCKGLRVLLALYSIQTFQPPTQKSLIIGNNSPMMRQNLPASLRSALYYTHVSCRYNGVKKNYSKRAVTN